MGASAAISINDASASARVRCDSTSTLFRRPAELADGLARKEPAPSVDHHGISPNNLGPPLSGTARRLGVMCPIGSGGLSLERVFELATRAGVAVAVRDPRSATSIWCGYTPTNWAFTGFWVGPLAPAEAPLSNLPRHGGGGGPRAGRVARRL